MGNEQFLGTNGEPATSGIKPGGLVTLKAH